MSDLSVTFFLSSSIFRSPHTLHKILEVSFQFSIWLLSLYFPALVDKLINSEINSVRWKHDGKKIFLKKPNKIETWRTINLFTECCIFSGWKLTRFDRYKNKLGSLYYVIVSVCIPSVTAENISRYKEIPLGKLNSLSEMQLTFS